MIGIAIQYSFSVSDGCRKALKFDAGFETLSHKTFATNFSHSRFYGRRKVRLQKELVILKTSVPNFFSDPKRTIFHLRRHLEQEIFKF